MDSPESRRSEFRTPKVEIISKKQNKGTDGSPLDLRPTFKTVYFHPFVQSTLDLAELSLIKNDRLFSSAILEVAV